MKSAKKEIRRLLHRASPMRLALVFVFVFAMVPLSIALRYYAVETLLLDDAALAPDIAKGSWSLFCKLPTCKSDIAKSDFVLFRLHDGTQIVRKVLAKSGDHVKFTAAGFVSVNDGNPALLENENVMIADREFDIPSLGDTLTLDSLTDIEFDYALNYLKSRNVPFAVDAVPYLGDEQLPLEVAGNTRIGSRPTSIREIHGLPWQELFLISHQIRRNLHSTQLVTFKRKAFNVEQFEIKALPKIKLDTTVLDSDEIADTVDIASIVAEDTINVDSILGNEGKAPAPTSEPAKIDSLVDTTEVAEVAEVIEEKQKLQELDDSEPIKKETKIGERIETILIEDQMFYVIAPTANHAADSRELGYISKDQIVGKLMLHVNLSELKALFE